MATKIFTPGTVIDSPWLNDVNFATYALLGDGTNPAPSKAAARTNLGLGTVATENILPVSKGGTGGTDATSALINLGLPVYSFMVHRNNVTQSIPFDIYTPLTFLLAEFNTAGWSNASWQPASGRPILIGGSVQFPVATAPGRLFICIYKNGVEWKRGTDIVVTTSSTQAQCTVQAVDMPNGTDVYQIRVYQTTGSGGAVNLDARPQCTYAYGTRL